MNIVKANSKTFAFSKNMLTSNTMCLSFIIQNGHSLSRAPRYYRACTTQYKKKQILQPQKTTVDFNQLKLAN